MDPPSQTKVPGARPGRHPAVPVAALSWEPDPPFRRPDSRWAETWEAPGIASPLRSTTLDNARPALRLTSDGTPQTASPPVSSRRSRIFHPMTHWPGMCTTQTAPNAARLWTGGVPPPNDPDNRD